MNNSLEVLKSIYKPLKYTLKGKVTILETSSGNYIVKEKTSDIRSLYRYLESRNFYNFPKLIDDSRKEVNVFEMLEDDPTPKEQKMDDLIDTVALLHTKTSYHKEVSGDKYQEIYDNIASNINYLKDLYNTHYERLLPIIYLSPSEYLLMRNISKVFDDLDFCQTKLDEWYEKVKNEKQQRVSIIHNNLDVSHLIRNKDNYLISWDHAKVDTPILDIVNLYHKDYYNYDFKSILDNYLKKVSLNDSEKELLFILMALPPEIDFSGGNEMQRTNNIREKIDYVFKTEELLRPYYSKDQEE